MFISFITLTILSSFLLVFSLLWSFSSFYIDMFMWNNWFIYLYLQISIYRRSFSEPESDYRYANHQIDGKNKIHQIHRESDPEQVNIHLWYYNKSCLYNVLSILTFRTFYLTHGEVDLSKLVNGSSNKYLITLPETLGFLKI